VRDAQLLARTWHRDISEHAARDAKIFRIFRLCCVHRRSVAAKEKLAEELEVLNTASDAHINAHRLFPDIRRCVG